MRPGRPRATEPSVGGDDVTIEVRVGPPVLTINQGSTFMVTDERGEIDPESEQGIFSADTRFVSFYQLYINQARWELLTSATTSYYAARLYLTNPPINTEEGEIAAHQVGLTVTRSVGDGVHEDLDVTNYSLEPVKFNLEVALRSDFADIFEVRNHNFTRKGRTTTVWDPERAELTTSYQNRDFQRALSYRLTEFDSPPQYANGRLYFEVELQSQQSWHACTSFILLEGDEVRNPELACNRHQLSGEVDRLQSLWRGYATKLTTANEDVYRTYRTSVEDMGALRLYDHDFDDDVWLPAAGVPWFVTIFGRDSLIVSLQNMMVHAPFAVGALAKLAEFQATEMDDWRDAEPGKIPHEIRFGELAHFHKIPHTPYYGTHDATSLYLITLHEAWKWMGDTRNLQRFRDVAEKCIDWIDHHGDLDGDGFQEYKTRSSLGYENVGWKDSGEAVVYPDGSQVKQPKALCELQGYVYDAKLRMAEACDALHLDEQASELRQQAAELRRRFNEEFWVEEIDCFAYGLDPDKRPIGTVASNAGHCLWSGIADPDKAARVVERFTRPDMWSGWGVRTLSADNPAYNPFAYQLGSVWPHDNGIIAAGFKRYGFADQANRLARDIFEAASYFDSYRLPELYAGLAREPGTFPVQYVGANIPQAWAAGSIFQLIQTILGLRADAPNGRLYVHPTLPRWLPDVRLDGLKVGRSTLSLRFWREGDTSRWEVLDQQGDIVVEEQPWGPWPSEEPSP
jgi:glycogen debranching enzyme